MEKLPKEIDCLDLYVLEIAMMPENEHLVKRLIEELEIKEAMRRC